MSVISLFNSSDEFTVATRVTVERSCTSSWLKKDSIKILLPPLVADL